MQSQVSDFSTLADIYRVKLIPDSATFKPNAMAIITPDLNCYIAWNCDIFRKFTQLLIIFI